MADYPLAGDDQQLGLLQRIFAALTGGNAGGAYPLAVYPLYYNPTTAAWDRQRGTPDGAFVVSAPSSTSPGLTQYSKAASADTNAAAIKTSRGKVYGFQIFNNTASAKFVKLYNKATAPVPSTDSALIVRRIVVPPNGVASYHVGQGLDSFTNGIGIAATGGLGDVDVTALAANDLHINVDYV